MKILPLLNYIVFISRLGYRMFQKYFVLTELKAKTIILQDSVLNHR